MKVFHRETELRTAGGLAVRDITEEVNDAVRDGIRLGPPCPAGSADLSGVPKATE